MRFDLAFAALGPGPSIFDYNNLSHRLHIIVVHEFLDHDVLLNEVGEWGIGVGKIA
jgi:hypothetical protein